MLVRPHPLPSSGRSSAKAPKVLVSSDIDMLLTVILFLPSVSFAAVTAGPLAPISIQSLVAYSTAKPCAATCLVYYGVWHCSLQGYHDLGKDLGCGCSPINACWCSAGIQPAATSYISNCVSKGCGQVPGVEQDMTSMISIYGAYCATANVEISSKAAETKIVTSPLAVASSAKPAPTVGMSVSSATGAVGQQPASTTAPGTKEEQDDEGLSKSDIIALATGLGVGLPSLAIGALALWFQLRRRRAAAEQPFISINTTPSNSQTQFVPGPTPTPTPPLHGYPNVYELGSRGMQGQYPQQHWM